MFGRSGSLDAIINRKPPSTWERFLNAPCAFLAKVVYEWHARRLRPPRSAEKPISVVCIADTHNTQPALPDGDILIHAGDLTQSGTTSELQSTFEWIKRQPHRHKIVIAGNHDELLDEDRDDAHGVAAKERASLRWGDVIYLQDTETTITCENGRQVRIYGSPRTPKHGGGAFQYPRAKDIWQDKIPEGTDILITHGPPRTHLDLGNLGCANLLREVWRGRPRLHVFGHIHAGVGTDHLAWDAVQMAYERTMIAGGGLCNLLRLLSCLAWSFVTPRVKARSTLVNAAMIGGHYDTELRKPISVVI